MAKKDKLAKKKEKGAEPDGGVAAALVQTARAARTKLTRNLADHGLYAGQDSVILALAEADGRSPGEIAASLNVRAPTVTKTVNRLAAQGFVEKRECAADGRKALIHLTERGREALRSVDAAIRGTEEAMLEGFSGKEAKALAKLLRRAERNLAGSWS